MPFQPLLALDHRLRKNHLRRGATPPKQGPVIRLACLGPSQRGMLICGNRLFSCVLGRSGRIMRKREGDGGTPRGRFALRAIFFRADRWARVPSGFQTMGLRPMDGWCDDPRSISYNKPVPHPSRPGHEVMWRKDGLYDVVIPLGFNDLTIRRGGGSAIFLHLLGREKQPTEGCIAVSAGDMRKILSSCGPGTSILV